MTPIELQSARAVEKARHVMAAEHPFFAVLALSMKPIARPDIETMATDGGSLFYNPAWVASLAARELRGVIAHEALHKANCHHTRRGSRDHDLWNLACDAILNRDLLRAGFVLPEGGFNLTGADPYAGMNAEQAYRKMVRDGMKAPACAWGLVLDAASASQPDKISQAEVEAQTLVRQAVLVAKSASGPGDSLVIARLVGDLNAPRRSWREGVREWAQNSATGDYCWSKPNKRYLQAGFIVPRWRPPADAHGVCVVDTSGSMDTPAVNACLSEVQGILDEARFERVTIVYCDAAVRGFESFDAGDQIVPHPVGGGGTRFAPAFEWISENCSDASGIIYLTDMGSSDFGEEPDVPLLWARYGSRATAPFGAHVDIDANA